jgi:hypothetical protein
MKKRQEQLALQREALLLKSQALRGLMAIHSNELRQSLSLADYALKLYGSVSSTVRRRPFLGVAITAAVFILTPKRIYSVAKSALLGWQTWQGLAAVMKRMRTNQSDE